MSIGHLAADRPLHIGTPVVVEGLAPDRDLSVVFEDDGESGYFHALDRSLVTQPILDSVCIYQVSEVEPGSGPSRLNILWSPDQSKAALLIDQRPHAVFDFRERRGYCRTGFPEPVADYGWTRHDWDESLREAFFPPR